LGEEGGREEEGETKGHGDSPRLWFWSKLLWGSRRFGGKIAGEWKMENGEWKMGDGLPHERMGEFELPFDSLRAGFMRI
jgi:hypothetical protein